MFQPFLVVTSTVHFQDIKQEVIHFLWKILYKCAYICMFDQYIYADIICRTLSLCDMDADSGLDKSISCLRRFICICISITPVTRLCLLSKYEDINKIILLRYCMSSVFFGIILVSFCSSWIFLYGLWVNFDTFTWQHR